MERVKRAYHMTPERGDNALVKDSGGHPQSTRWPWPRRVYAAALAGLERSFHLKVFLIHSRPLGGGQNAPENTDSAYSFREITEPELLRFADDPTLELTHDFVRNAAKRGDICFGVLHGGQLVAHRWYAFSGTTPCDDGLCIRYAYSGRAYGYKMFTHPLHRGKRLQLHSMTYADPLLLSRGYTHAISYVAPHNFASLRAQSRLHDVTLVGVIGSVRVFGRHLSVGSPGVIRNRISIGTQT